jgi:hypothetical protein
MPSTGLIVMMEYPGLGFEQVGFTKLVRADLVTQFVGGNHGMDHV